MRQSANSSVEPEQQAPEKDQALFRYLVEHEPAIRHFVEMELANKPSATLKKVNTLSINTAMYTL